MLQNGKISGRFTSLLDVLVAYMEQNDDSVRFSDPRAPLTLWIGIFRSFSNLDKYGKEYSYLSGTGGRVFPLGRVPATSAAIMISKWNCMGPHTTS